MRKATAMLYNALKVIVSSPNIREYLLANDPMALKQAEQAIAEEEAQGMCREPFGYPPEEEMPNV